MKRPKVILKADVNADIKNSALFVKYNFEYLELFLPNDLQYLIKNKISKNKIAKILKPYVLKTFDSKKFEIKENIRKAQSEWKSTENDYFNLVNKIFKNHPWPKGKYVGFASVFTMYPRSIQNKTFFFPGVIYSKGTPPTNTVIGHELLHFIFFDYIKKKYNLDTDSEIKSKEKRHLWKVSEVFNSVIESWNPYYKIFKFKTPPYTGRDLYKKMRRQWVQNPDIDNLLDKLLLKYLRPGQVQIRPVYTSKNLIIPT